MVRKLSINDAAAIVTTLPGVAEGVSYGTRSWKVGKKFLMREKEKMDSVLVLKLGSVDEQELLMERDPEAFFITDHYRGYPAVLVRLAKIRRADLVALLTGAWRAQATKALIRAHEET